MAISDEQLLALLLGLAYSRRKLVNALTDHVATGGASLFRRSSINPMLRRYANGPDRENKALPLPRQAKH